MRRSDARSDVTDRRDLSGRTPLSHSDGTHDENVTKKKAERGEAKRVAQMTQSTRKLTQVDSECVSKEV